MNGKQWNRVALLAAMVFAGNASAHAQPAETSSTADAPEPGASETESAPAPVVEEPAPAPVVEEPAPEQEPVAATASEDEEPENCLLPEGEAELMDRHAVELGRIRFVPGRGLQVTSEDGRFRLETRVRGQARYTMLGGPAAEFSQQLTLRRVRTVFSGYFFGEDNRFKMELAVSPRDEGISSNPGASGPRRTPLLDLYFEFRQLRDFTIRIGQYKLPSNRQRVISSGNLQLVDRALLNGEFTLDRDLAIDFRSKNFLGLDLFKYYVGVGIGQGRDAVGFHDFGMNYFARFEVLPFGMFDDYSEVDFARREEPGLSIGAMYSFQHRNPGLRQTTSRLPADGGTTDYHLFIADAIFKWRGFSAQWEFAYRQGDRNPGGAVDDLGNLIPVAEARNGWSTMLQAGYLIPRLPLEVAGRYGLIRGTGTTSLGDSSELGVGVSWYLGRHPFKIQADVFRLWGGSGSFGDGANQLRIQLQGSL